MGGSAGGYLAQMVGFTVGEEGLEPTAPYPGVSSAVSAIVNFYGSSNYVTKTKPAPNGTRTPELTDLASQEKIFGVPHDVDRSVWRKFSPIGHITSSAPPVLILHGLADPNSDYEQAIELAQVLADKGVSHQLIMLAGVGHSVDYSRRRQRAGVGLAASQRLLWVRRQCLIWVSGSVHLRFSWHL